MTGVGEPAVRAYAAREDLVPRQATFARLSEGVFGAGLAARGAAWLACPVIQIQVRREVCGQVVARAACGLAWETTLGDLDQAASPLLGALNPYGDAVFNRRQIPALLQELDRLPAERSGALGG